MFTVKNAKDAILKLAQVKGNYRAALIERMFRLETGHFTSGQYIRTGSAGMEKGKWPGISSNVSYYKAKDNHDGRMVDFIIWGDVYDFCIYLSNYIDRNGGDWARWNSRNVYRKIEYKHKVKNVKNVWVLSSGIEEEFKNLASDKKYTKFKNKDVWNIKVGEPSITDESTEDEQEVIEEYITKIADVETKDAVGIWQIIKLVADQYSLSQNINDATIAFSQGSLLNYIEKVVQKPWLQFFGDTVGDQYYFQCRKEPFDFDGYSKLPLIKIIQENEVLSDELSWYEGEIYSWYQIIPKGSFLGEQNLIFAYVKAVFFEEYAEIWGSKPNIQVSNYLNFNKIDEDNKMFNKAIEDLRYMVESNAFLPFTRQGTIVINGDNTIRRGYKIYYAPTGEYFYIDSVTHNYSTDDSGPTYTTTLRVSKGVVKNEFVRYFSLINFDNPPPLIQDYEEEVYDRGLLFYFDNGRSYLIDLEENFSTSTSGTDIKMVNQINEFPNLRNELFEINQKYISQIADLINKHKDATFVCNGNMDEDAKIKFSKLSRKRAETVKNLVITEYLKKYQDLTFSQLNSKIEIVADINSTTPYVSDDATSYERYDDNNGQSDLREKAYKRNAVFYVKPYKVKKTREIPQKGVAWSVNRPNFYYFFNRKQFISDVRK
jgi:hypothetical protein